MNASQFFFAVVSPAALVIGGVAAFLFVFFLFAAVWASRYRKVAPDQVMIVSGRNYQVITPEGKRAVAGFRIVRGGGTFVWPIYEQTLILSLKLIPLTLDRTAVTAQDGAKLDIHAKGQIKIKGDDVSVMRAAQAFASKSPSEIAEASSLILEGVLRKLVQARPAAEIIRDGNRLAEQVQSAAQQPLSDLGLEIVAFGIVSVKNS